MGARIIEEDREVRSPRILRCEIVDEFGEAQSYLIRNISRKGIGGSGNEGLEVGRHITINLLGLGTVTGSVRWCSGDRFGIHLDDEIEPERIRYVGVSLEGPRFRVNDLHRPVHDSRRPGF